MDNLPDYLLSAVVTCVGALFTYLIQSYFKTIKKSSEALSAEISKLEGKIDMIANELRSNSREVYGLTTELKAVWRFIENANRRPSDGGSNGRDRN
jgi:hypothetical protein